jgi:hypothetical protein
MKKSIYYFVIGIIALLLVPTKMIAHENFIKTDPEEPVEIPYEIQRMIDRVYEIREMDKSELTRTERRELRKEVREIKKEVRSSNSGIFISTGALIIILLLIIIL